MVVKDRMWIWGHPEGRFNEEGLYGPAFDSRMTPFEGAMYLGARNMIMDPCGWEVNRRSYNKSFTPLQRVCWEIYDACENPASVDQVIEEAKEFPNICCGILDDFYLHNGDSFRQIPVEKLYQVRDRLHNNPVKHLDMWMVTYTYQFGEDPQTDAEFQPYVDVCDGITMWIWKESELADFEEKFKIFKKMAAGKRKMIGLYLYNFGEDKQATAEGVRWQLNRYLELMQAGEIEGVVLHTNNMADMDFEAYEAAVEWMKVHGEDPVPD